MDLNNALDNAIKYDNIKDQTCLFYTLGTIAIVAV